MLGYPDPEVVIGGPHDGQRAYSMVRGAPRLCLPTHAPMTWERDDMGEVAAQSEVRRAEYRPFRHAIGGIKFSVWVPAELSDDDADKLVFGRIGEVWENALAGAKCK